MKKKYILVFLTVIMALFIAAISTLASNMNIPEPSRVGKDIPNHIVWNSVKGVYELADKTDLWDPNDPTSDTGVEAQTFAADSQYDEWIQELINSSDPLDQAIIKWLNNRKLSNPYASYYSPDEDETFKEITKLGIKYLPEMIDRIQKDVGERKYDGEQAGILMYAVSRITNVESLKMVNVSTDGMQQWISNYKNALKNASLVVQNSSDKESFKKGLKECGIFVAPYVAEKESLGDTNISSMFDIKSFSDDELKILKDMVEKESSN